SEGSAIPKLQLAKSRSLAFARDDTRGARDDRLFGLRRRQMLGAAQRLQNLARAAMPELVGETNAAQLRLRRIQRDLAAQNALASHIPDEAVEDGTTSAQRAERADRDLAATFERAEKSAFGARRDHGLAVRQRREDRPRARVVSANL